MYRYIVDNAITYTPDDLVLFRESPFAVWMERLNLENPDHGIPPDLDSIGAYPESPQQDDIVATLRAEGRNVALINAEDDEPERRVATLEAMRAGADFIVNGQLAVDTLSGAVDLLMRTSGFSELGDFLYIPCETRVDNSLQSAFRLCFAADLLANLQGQLPAQMLIIRDGAEVVPLQTEDHIYYYRAVQKRFLSAMDSFRKHRMPDPAESASFGRWAECASEVLKQRALSGPQQEEEIPEETSDAVVELPQLRVASGAHAGAQFDLSVSGRQGFATANLNVNSGTLEGAAKDRGEASVTLAEQARLLKPGSYRNGTPPGHTPSLARIGKPLTVSTSTDSDAAMPDDTIASPDNSDEPPVDSASDEALDNLEFIGSGPGSANAAKTSEMDLDGAVRAAPAPNLRDTSTRESTREVEASVAEITPGSSRLTEREPRPPVFLPPEQNEAAIRSSLNATPGSSLGAVPDEQLGTHFQDRVESETEDSGSVVDLDSTPVSTGAPVVQRAEAVLKRLIRDDPMFKKADPADFKSNSSSKSGRSENDPARGSSFSSSLQTSEELSEN